MSALELFFILFFGTISFIGLTYEVLRQEEHHE